MTDDLKTWKRDTALKEFNRLIAHADKRGEPMSDIRAARAAAGYVDATADDVMRWVREASHG